jgi:hypothetical protein
MCSTLTYSVAVVLALLALQWGDGVSARGVGLDSDNVRTAAPVVLRIPREDALTPGHIAELRRGSAIARDLLARVANMPNTILILRAAPALASQAHVYGRSRFWTNNGRLFGFIEYQVRPLHNFGTECLIVHELAHALEIGGADRARGTAGLRTFVLSRAIESDRSISDGSETEFPQQVALAVLFELLGKRARFNTLESLARDHGIDLPPLVEPGDEQERASIQ